MEKFAHEKGTIPAPATATLPTAGKRSRVIKSVLVASAVGIAVHLLAGQVLHVLFNEPKRPRPLVGKAAEDLFLTVPDPNVCLETSRHYTAKPHPAGSANDLSTALDFLHLLQSELGVKPPANEPVFPAGSPESRDATLSIPHTHIANAWIDEYYPVMNTPLDRNVQVLDEDGNVIWDADLTEHTDDTDPEAGQYYDFVPTFHGLSKGGDVSGKLIYANYGLKEDYDELISKGVNLTGAIILARYGGNFRGLKVKGAQEAGAVGILIYSDTRDDGPVTVENGYKPYPNGPARSPTSVQRGSVQFISMYPGDPTTPGYPSYENTTRTEGLNIPSIPSLPISSANAAKLLELSTGNGTVRLLNNVDTKVTPIWNTMAVIPGHIQDEIVVIGNHRDAWVMGAADPTSGTATISETIRGLGVLIRKGWKPLRTIVFASWDAEEYGLIGSTEWGEDFADFIDKHVVAYLNLDSSVGGSRWSAKGSPLLAHFIQQTASEIPHPTDAGHSLWDARTDSGPYTGGETALANAALEASPEVGVLGSGSDYTVFLQRNGVASSDGGFGGSRSDAIYHYHSVYDSERWMELYGDPGFFRHIAVAKHLGLQILRLTGNIILPFNTTHYTYEIEKYLDRVEDIATAKSVSVNLDGLRQSIHQLQSASLALDDEKLTAEKELVDVIEKWKKNASKIEKLKRKLRKAYCKIQKSIGHPCEGEDEVSKLRIGRLPGFIEERSLDFSLNREALYGFSLQAGLDEPLRGCEKAGTRHIPRLPLFELRRAVKRVRVVNKKLASFERGFISEDGIPDREWYKHLGVAPGKWLGYGATTLPALTEAITIEGNVTLAQYEAQRLTSLVDNLVEELSV